VNDVTNETLDLGGVAVIRTVRVPDLVARLERVHEGGMLANDARRGGLGHGEGIGNDRGARPSLVQKET